MGSKRAIRARENKQEINSVVSLVRNGKNLPSVSGHPCTRSLNTFQKLNVINVLHLHFTASFLEMFDCIAQLFTFHGQQTYFIVFSIKTLHFYDK